MTDSTDHHAHIVEELNAMSNPETWLEYKKNKMRSVAKRIDVEACEKFADYLNDKMIDAIKATNGSQVYKNWQETNKTEKKQFAQSIVDTFIEFIIRDIWDDNVTMYKADGSTYEKRRSFNKAEDEYLDRVWKEDNTKKPNIVVTDISHGLMGCSPTGELVINFDHVLWRSLVAFLMDLRHELDHIVNMFFPSIHPLALNDTARRTAMRYYIQPEDDTVLYDDNPVEMTANLKRAEFAERCSLLVTGKHWNVPQNVDTHGGMEH